MAPISIQPEEIESLYRHSYIWEDVNFLTHFCDLLVISHIFYLHDFITHIILIGNIEQST